MDKYTTLFLLSRREILSGLVAQGLHGIDLRKACREFEMFQLGLKRS